MKRAFLSLFILLSTSILAMGFVLDKAWDYFHPPSNNRLLHTLGVGFVNHLINIPPAQRETELKSITKNNSAFIECLLFDINDIASGALKDRLRKESTVVIQSQSADQTKTITYYYVLATDSTQVLQIKEMELQPNRWVYTFFVLLFYLSIALMLLLWLWPLARDLVKLGQYVNQFKGDKSTKALSLNTHSLVFPVAQKLFEMEQRIADLVQSHIEMRSAVSHELRTPLARMKFALAMLENETLSPRTVKVVEQLESDIGSMETLINSLLAYAGFDIHNHQLDQRAGYALDFVQEIVKRTRGVNPIKIKVIDNLQGQLLTCEWQLMGQAIENLLSNAQDFASAQIQLTLNSTRTDWELIVEDDGPGVPEDERARIFELFYRGRGPLSPRTGFGLGLALVARVLQWHGGVAICAASHLGGASFVLRWPKTV